MNNLIFLKILSACALMIMSINAHAVLVDRGNETIYDSNSNLTWLKNANYAATELSDTRRDEIIAAVVSVHGRTLTNSDFIKINGSYNGKMSTWGSIAWADQLVFGGFDDWRLPTTTQFDDPTCSSDVRGVLFYEHRLYCLGGEMELLDATLIQDTGVGVWFEPLFNNVIDSRYWTDTIYRNEIDPCIYYPAYDVPCVLDPDNGQRKNFYWQVSFTGYDNGFEYDQVVGLGNKGALRGTQGRYAWPVRDNCGFSVELAANTWTMISLPCTPIERVNDVESVFGDDLDVGNYDYSWVVYEWNPATDSYTKLSLSDPLDQNRGYWILSIVDANLNSEGDDTGLVFSAECAVPEGCYEILLTPPADGETEQYNLIGHAFPGDIPWKDVRIRAGGTVYTPSAASAANTLIMDKTIWLYNGNGYDMYDDSTVGMEGQLVAFDGFWVRTLENAPADTTLLLPKVPFVP